MKKPLWRSWLSHFHFLLEKVKYKNSEVKSSSVWRSVYRIFAVFRRKSSTERKKKYDENITKSEKIPVGKFHTL